MEYFYANFNANFELLEASLLLQFNIFLPYFKFNFIQPRDFDKLEKFSF